MEEEHKRKIGAAQAQWWANATEEQKEARRAAIAEAMRKKWDGRSPEEVRAIRKAISQAKVGVKKGKKHDAN